MGYSDLLTPHPDVLSDEGIEGITELENLNDAENERIEAGPAGTIPWTVRQEPAPRLRRLGPAAAPR